MHFLLGCRPRERGGVGTRRQIDSDQVGGTIFCQVLLGEFFPHLIGRDADNRVLARVEIRRKLEEVHSDGAFFERPLGPADGVLYDVNEEFLAAFATAKGSGFQQAV